MKKNFLNTYILKSKSEIDPVIIQLQEVYDELSLAYIRFNSETNEDLLESIIYDIQSLKARYRYLLKTAKENGSKCNEIRIIERGMTE